MCNFQTETKGKQFLEGISSLFFNDEAHKQQVCEPIKISVRARRAFISQRF